MSARPLESARDSFNNNPTDFYSLIAYLNSGDCPSTISLSAAPANPPGLSVTTSFFCLSAKSTFSAPPPPTYSYKEDILVTVKQILVEFGSRKLHRCSFPQQREKNRFIHHNQKINSVYSSASAI
jgi:hypothetical protein